MVNTMEKIIPNVASGVMLTHIMTIETNKAFDLWGNFIRWIDVKKSLKENEVIELLS